VIALWTGVLLAFGGMGLFVRRQLLTNAATRALGALLGLALVTPLAVTGASLFVGLPMSQRSAFSWIASAGVAAVGEIGILPQIWPCAVVYLIGATAVLTAPEWTIVVQPMVIVSTTVILVRALLRHAAMSRVRGDRARDRVSRPG
jgi:hypothetical protein